MSQIIIDQDTPILELRPDQEGLWRSRADICQEMGTTPGGLRRMVRRGELEQRGLGRRARYRVAPTPEPPPEDPAEALPRVRRELEQATEDARATARQRDEALARAAAMRREHLQMSEALGQALERSAELEARMERVARQRDEALAHAEAAVAQRDAAHASLTQARGMLEGWSRWRQDAQEKIDLATIRAGRAVQLARAALGLSWWQRSHRAALEAELDTLARKRPSEGTRR